MSQFGSCYQGCQVGIFKVKFQKFGLFFIVVWHEKMVFGMCVIVWHLFGLFHGADMETHCLAFFKTSGSVITVGLESNNFFSGQRSSLFCHSPILEDTSGSAV